METPEIGDKVRVVSTADCDGEGLWHGYHPYVKGLEGVIVPNLSHVDAPDHHPWRVDFGRNLSPPDTTPITWSYFKASELVLMLEAK